jgi:hypothetical protein
MESPFRGNPFKNPTTLHDLSRFIGRSRYLRSIFDGLMARQNISLVGPQRIGKTSILKSLGNKDIQKRLGFEREDFLYVYSDLQKYSLADHDDLFAHLNAEIRQQQGHYVAGVKPEQESHVEFEKLLEAFEKQRLYPVILIDTFDRITRYNGFGPDLFGFLRAQAIRGLVSYVTASIQRLHVLCPDEDNWDSPFHNIFMPETIGPFTLDEAHELLTELPRRAGLSFSEEERAWLLRMAGPHPYILTHTASILYDRKQEGQVDLEQIRKDAYQNIESYFQGRLQRMSPEERAALAAEVEQGGNPRGRYPELNASMLFHEYLRAMVARDKPPVSEMSSRDFKKILANLNNLRALGECALTRLPLIAERIQQERAENLTDKGQVVRRALREAFEGLRGTGIRREESSEWQSYNILRYRYFENNMDHKYIMARLGIPERSYYRRHDEAINSLWLSLRDLKDRQPPGEST